MDKITLDVYGIPTGFDCAHIIDCSGRVVAYVAEPSPRNIGNADYSGDFNEESLRFAVRAIADKQYPTWEYIQFDPGRDNVESVQNA